MEKPIVNLEDCYLIIRKCVSVATFDVVNFKVRPFEDKEREYHKPDSVLEISVKISKNISRFRFFLKRFSSKSPPLKELFNSIKASEREIFFYNNLLPDLTKQLENFKTDFIPQFLLGKANDIIILEDMSLRSYVVAKKANPHLLDRFHISVALKALARLHASTLCYEEVKATRLFTEDNIISQDPLWRKEEGHLGYKVIQSGINGTKKLLAELQQLEKLDQSLLQKIDALVDNCLELSKPQVKYRNVLCHGNIYSKNLLFKYERSVPVECALINFEFCRYFPPAFDVLTLIFYTTSKLFRQHYFTYLVQYYYDSLRNELTKQTLDINEVLPLVSFQESINYLMPLVKLKTVLHLQEYGAKDGFYKAIKKEEMTYRQFLYEDQSEFLSSILKKDPMFKVMIIEALEELLDTLNDPRVSRENCYEILEKRLDTTVYDLSEFYINPCKDKTNNLELVMAVAGDNKDGTFNELKYLLECDMNSVVKVVNEITNVTAAS